MSSTPLAQLLDGVPGLNSAQNDYVYTVVGDTVVGRWNIVSARYIDYDAAAGTIYKDYSITVSFNENKERFDFTERKHDSFRFGGVNRTAAGHSPVLSYKFETSLIKDPLFDYLVHNGWKAKSDWFNR